MYLSRLTLDPHRCARELRDVRAMHGLIMRAFPTGVGRVLWRDQSDNVLVLSGDQPDWAAVSDRVRVEQRTVQMPSAPGRYAFTLTYSPTKCVERKRRCVPQDERPAHLARLIARKGAQVLEVSTPYGEEVRGSGGERLVRVTAHGTLTVTDPDEFALALATGFGAHRAYGCGLMTVHPA